MEGAVLTRLGGLRVLRVGDNVFINSERLEMANAEAADALCRYTIIGKKRVGRGTTGFGFRHGINRID